MHPFPSPSNMIMIILTIMIVMIIIIILTGMPILNILDATTDGISQRQPQIFLLQAFSFIPITNPIPIHRSTIGP